MADLPLRGRPRWLHVRRDYDGIVTAVDAQRERVTLPMHIVVIGWLFVMALTALTLSSPLAGIAFFAGVGLTPVVLAMWLAVRRARSLVLEQQVNPADDRHAKSDQ